MRALSVYLQTWPIDLARRRLKREGGPRRAEARGEELCYLLTTDVAQRRLVAACCERSAAAGVRPGMDLTHARALLPSGQVWTGAFRPERDGEALRALAAWATRFSPRVAPDPPDGLLLDISGCERVFRGEARLVNGLADAIGRMGFAVRAAAAPTFGCAWAVARYGRRERSTVPERRVGEAIAPLPVESLRISEEAAAGLREVGVERVEHVLNLARGALPARFGDELLLRIDQAFGRALEMIEPVRPVEPPRMERVFDGPTTQYEAVELTVRGLIQRLSSDLAKRESGVRRLDLSLKRVDDRPVVITIAMGRPSRSPQHLWSLLRPHLERANLGFGVEEISLVAARVGRLRHEQAGITGAGDGIAAEKAVGELTDVLLNRLGPDRLAQAELTESHIPERASRAVSLRSDAQRQVGFQPMPPGATVGVRGNALRLSGSAMPEGLESRSAFRPTLLFPAPEPAAAVAITPDGPPSLLRWRGREHAVGTAIGPERVAAEWWRGRDPTRDYFKVQLGAPSAGRWLWVYREVQTNQWFVHGEWA